MEESDFIRDTYDYFLHKGISNDGLADGVEYTRQKQIVPPWENEVADTTQREETPVDRYGFFDTPDKRNLPTIVLSRAAYVHRRFFVRARKTRAPKKRMHQPSAQAVWSVRRHLESLNEVLELRRTRKWYSMVDEEQRRIRVDVSRDLLLKRVYKGIPDEMRGLAWDALSSSQAYGHSQQGTRHRHTPQPVNELLSHASEHDVQIDLDVPRTVRGHERFYTRYGRGQCELFCVLHAMSLFCNECGYCQGMGPSAAMLLMHMPAQHALKVMERLHDEYGFHDVYRPGFPGLRSEFYVLRQLLATFVPRFARILSDAGLAPSAYATRWLMTVYHGVLPYSTQMRVWDVFMAQGRDALLLVAVAILRVLDAQCYDEHTSDILDFVSMQILPEDDNAMLTWIRHAMKDPAVQSCIAKSRTDWKRLVELGKDVEEFV